MLHISDDLAQELLDLETGEKDEYHLYEKVVNYHYDDSRWSSRWFCVFKMMIDGKCWAFQYELGLTEMQENKYPWDSWHRENDNGVECFEVESVARTVVNWYPKK